MKIDYVIRGGYVLDGSSEGSLPVRADVAISGDKIAAIGELSHLRAEHTIDINDRYICPGFIDVHGHSDFVILADGREDAKICQGVTTEVNGNCGMSAAPLYGAALQQREAELKELGIKERWNTFPEFYQLLSMRQLAVNFATLTGHGNLRASVAGYEDRPLSEKESVRAKELLNESMEAGSRGLSTGLIYPPGVYADTGEIISLAREAAARNGIYASHMRSEGDRLIESIDEVITIARQAGIQAQISHLKTSDEKNWGKLETAFQRIEDANRNNLRITCDRYPYIASSTDLDAVLPSWAFEGGNKMEIKRLKTEQERLMRDIRAEHPDPSVWEKVVVSSVITDSNKWMEGKSIKEISLSQGKSEMKCLFDILLEENLRVGAVFFTMNEDNLKAILAKPYTMIGSDSTGRSFDGITASGKPHPRGFGSFPRVLGKYVREDSVMELGEAVYKMTGLPAQTFQIDRRGAIAEGCYADIVVFDPDTIQDTAEFASPFQKPDGIDYVFVNGSPAVYEGRLSGAMAGRVI